MYACTDVNMREFGASASLESDWSIVESCRKQKFLLVFGVKDLTMLIEFKITCGNTGLNWLVSRIIIRRLGNHMRFFVKDRLANDFIQYYVGCLD